MHQILILGAGKSSHHLIQYLIDQSETLKATIRIGDINFESITQRYGAVPCIQLFDMNAPSEDVLDREISQASIVISMLPALLHAKVAKFCLSYSKNLLTPSYISDEMKAMSHEVTSKGILFLNELGFDPGIDHMSTMEIYHKIKEEGGELYSYKSYAGGLVAPESDDNPWHYKFSWNPRNVILAGQGGIVQYLNKKVHQLIPFFSLFERAELVTLNNGLQFESYANRDSLKYIDIYEWQNIDTILRGTFRMGGYCAAWNVILKMGLTDDSHTIKMPEGSTLYDFYAQFYPSEEYAVAKNNFLKTMTKRNTDDIVKKCEYIGFWDNSTLLRKREGTIAAIFQDILEEKWKLKSGDKDWVVMTHFFEYELNNKRFQIESSLSMIGESDYYTAMSKTVGLPIAVACELILLGKIKESGVQIPILPSIYQPIMSKLKDFGIYFDETKLELN